MDALNMLLGDYNRKDFFNNYWDKKSLCLPHGDNRFNEFISMDELEEQVEKCAISKVMYKEDGKIKEAVVTKSEQFKKGTDPNLTMCATYVEKTGIRREFLQSLHSQVKSLSDYYFNCYYSPDNHGYGLHMDPHPVWILQVEGQKHWQVGYETVCPYPQHAFIMQPGKERVKLAWGTFDRPKDEDMYEVILKPGDALYIPAGCWHEARAHESHSLAMTLAHARITAFDIFAYVLQRAVNSYPHLMNRLPGAPVEEALDGADDPLMPRLEEAHQLLKEMLDEKILPENLKREYYMHIERKKNFPQFYEMQFKAPDTLSDQVDEGQAKRAREKAQQ